MLGKQIIHPWQVADSEQFNLQCDNVATPTPRIDSMAKQPESGKPTDHLKSGILAIPPILFSMRPLSHQLNSELNESVNS